MYSLSIFSWDFFYISPLHKLFCHKVIVIYMFVLICFFCFLQQYVCIIHKIHSLIIFYHGNIVIYISCVWLILPLYHRNHWTVFVIVNEHLFVWVHHLSVTCIKTHIFVLNFSISHKFDSLLGFLSFISIRPFLHFKI